MREYEVKVGALKIRVNADNFHEAQLAAEKMLEPTDTGKRLLSIFGINKPVIESVEEVKDLPVGAGSEAD